jgi:methionyl-tRNA formyltransferase
LKHEIDTGNILLQRSTHIGPEENAGDLYVRLMQLGADALIEGLKRIEQGDVRLIPQPATSGKHAPKIQKEDCRIDWNQSVLQVHNFVRGMNPFPGAYTMIDENGTPDVWKIRKCFITDLPSDHKASFSVQEDKLMTGCNDFMIQILEIQPPGKKSMPAAAFINGYRDRLKQIKRQ